LLHFKFSGVTKESTKCWDLTPCSLACSGKSLALDSYFLDVLFDHEDGDSTLFRNVDEPPSEHRASYPRNSTFRFLPCYLRKSFGGRHSSHFEAMRRSSEPMGLKPIQVAIVQNEQVTSSVTADFISSTTYLLLLNT
jgi:hypothetical protein